MGTFFQSCWSSILSCSSFVGNFCLVLWRLDFLIAPEDNDDEKSFCKLENHVEERKEEKWPNDFRGEGHIEDGRTELNVLESCFHADGASAAWIELEESRENVTHQKAREGHQGGGSQ